MTPAPDQIQCEDKSPAVATQFKGAFLEELAERAAGLKATCKAANMVVRRALEASEQPPLSDAANNDDLLSRHERKITPAHESLSTLRSSLAGETRETSYPITGENKRRIVFVACHNFILLVMSLHVVYIS